MPDAALIKEALNRALTSFGREKLAQRLGVPPHVLEAWVSGHASMPDRNFHLLLSIIGEIDDPTDPRNQV
jgi:hypothetical protein